MFLARLLGLRELMNAFHMCLPCHTGCRCSGGETKIRRPSGRFWGDARGTGNNSTVPFLLGQIDRVEQGADEMPASEVSFLPRAKSLSQIKHRCDVMQPNPVTGKIVNDNFCRGA